MKEFKITIDGDDDSDSDKKNKNPFDVTGKSPFDILYECGRHSLPESHAVSILRGHISHTSLQDLSHAILDPDSPEMESYNDGQAEMSASLRQSTIDNEKDAYKSMNNEDRQRTINQAIHKNFGIGE